MTSIVEIARSPAGQWWEWRKTEREATPLASREEAEAAAGELLDEAAADRLWALWIDDAAALSAAAASKLRRRGESVQHAPRIRREPQPAELPEEAAPVQTPTPAPEPAPQEPQPEPEWGPGETSGALAARLAIPNTTLIARAETDSARFAHYRSREVDETEILARGLPGTSKRLYWVEEPQTLPPGETWRGQPGEAVSVVARRHGITPSGVRERATSTELTWQHWRRRKISDEERQSRGLSVSVLYLYWVGEEAPEPAPLVGDAGELAGEGDASQARIAVLERELDALRAELDAERTARTLEDDTAASRIATLTEELDLARLTVGRLQADAASGARAARSVHAEERAPLADEALTALGLALVSGLEDAPLERRAAYLAAMARVVGEEAVNTAKLRSAIADLHDLHQELLAARLRARATELLAAWRTNNT